jgi:membrane-associated protease RseP (regulator of RpoE activity)
MRFWLSVLMMMLVCVSPAAAKRVALVIANGSYAHVAALNNPASDARLIAASLKQAGFDEVVIRSDLGKSQLEAELRSFGMRAEGAEVALIYYAGHGIEAGGQNYLIPVDAQLARDRDLEVEATRLDTALTMAEAARMRIIILDACRNNPFTASMQRTIRNRAIGRGLAAVEPEGETLVVYAAKAGATAADGEGGNSPFAQALAKRLTEPGLEISLLFRAVRDDVLAKTGRTQEPFTYGSLSGQAFYFRPPLSSTSTSVRLKPARPASPEADASTETLFWKGALDVNSEAAFRSYIEKYPNGQFVSLAYGNIKKLVQPGGGRGYVGIVMSGVDAATADALDIRPVRGELVQRVAPGSPAERAGIRGGDVLTKIGNTDITPTVALASITSNLPIGATASIELIHEGRTVRTTLTISGQASYGDNISDIRDPYQITASDTAGAKGVAVRSLGLTLAPLSAGTAQKLKLGQTEGLFVLTSVVPSGNADAKGLVATDIIMAVNSKVLNSPQAIEKAVATALQSGRSHIMIRVKRVNKNPLHIPIRIK